MSNAVAITGGGDQSKRQELDFYPTPANCTEALLLFLYKEQINFHRVWEPACGDGAISKVLEDHFLNVFSTELRTDGGYGEGGLDFLTHQGLICDAIITNPPFNVAEKFIVKALECADVVCMLLKSQYWHAKSRQKLFATHTHLLIFSLLPGGQTLWRTLALRVKLVVLPWTWHGRFGLEEILTLNTTHY